MHKNNRLKESISAFFSPVCYFISFPLLLAQAGFHRFHNGLERLIFVFSVTGELNHIPHWAQALSTLKTLLALAVSSRKEKVIVHLKRMASLQRFPAGLKCRPVGFFMVTF